MPVDEPRYGWVVVWATFVALGVIFGVAYSFAAFFEPFTREFEAQRADVSLVFGLCGLIYFAFGAFGGMLSDRLGPRLVAGAGMLCIALGLIGASLARSMVEVTLAYGVGVGVGIALVYTPAIGTVQPWFTRRRGLAAGIASAGIGAGTLVVPLLAAAAIAAVAVARRDDRHRARHGVGGLHRRADVEARAGRRQARRRHGAGHAAERSADQPRVPLDVRDVRLRRVQHVHSVRTPVGRGARPRRARRAGGRPGRPDRHRQPDRTLRDRRAGRSGRAAGHAGARAGLARRVVHPVGRGRWLPRARAVRAVDGHRATAASCR